MTLDVRVEAGPQALLALVREADVLVKNFRPVTLESWGLTYEEFSAVNRRLVLVRVSGFGQTGRYATRAGSGAIGDAMGGPRCRAGWVEQGQATA